MQRFLFLLLFSIFCSFNATGQWDEIDWGWTIDEWQDWYDEFGDDYCPDCVDHLGGDLDEVIVCGNCDDPVDEQDPFADPFDDPCSDGTGDDCLCFNIGCDEDPDPCAGADADPCECWGDCGGGDEEEEDNDKVKLVELVNSLCSETAKAQIAEALASNRLSEIEVRIVDQFVDNNLFGLHQVYDDNGNLLEWDSTINDFNGTPSYLQDGSYASAVITIYRENIRQSCTGNGCGNAQYNGINLTLEESVASTFSHELHHNTDLEFIIDLRNRREGNPHNNVGPHDNVTPQEEQVWNELNNCN